MGVSEFTECVIKWLHVSNNSVHKPAGNVDSYDCDESDSEVKPSDRISNVLTNASEKKSSRKSNASSRSSRSSTVSARIQAEAERAALEAHLKLALQH